MQIRTQKSQTHQSTNQKLITKRKNAMQPWLVINKGCGKDPGAMEVCELRRCFILSVFWAGAERRTRTCTHSEILLCYCIMHAKSWYGKNLKDSTAVGAPTACPFRLVLHEFFPLLPPETCGQCCNLTL